MRLMISKQRYSLRGSGMQYEYCGRLKRETDCDVRAGLGLLEVGECEVRRRATVFSEGVMGSYGGILGFESKRKSGTIPGAAPWRLVNNAEWSL